MKSKVKSGEPSMEEILASIRQIVAEEPTAEPSAVAPPQAAMALSASVDPQRTRADLDKDLEDLVGAGEAEAPAADVSSADRPATGNGTRSGWFFNRSSSAAAAPEAEPAAAPTPGRLSETLELARANIRRATAAASKSPLARLRDKADAANGSEPTNDLGAVVPGRYDGVPGAQTSRPVAIVAPHADAKATTPNQPAGAAHVSMPAATAPQWARASNPLSADAATRPSSGNGHAGLSRTLEDTVVELLRPMLRDWLDANMPRIMERVMRDTAAGSKPKT